MYNSLFKRIFQIITISLAILIFVSCTKKRDGSLTDKELSSLKLEIEFGRTLAAQIINSYGSYNNKKVQKYVNLVGKAMAMNVGRSEIHYHFAILNSGSVFSVSTPGGYVLVTKGLLKELDSEEQLAGILSHEIQHINRKHLLTMTLGADSKKTISQTLEQAENLDSENKAKTYGELLDRAIEILFIKGFPKDKEAGADEFAIESIHSIGYDTEGYIKYLRKIIKLEKQRGKINIFRAKPNGKFRLAKIIEIQKLNGLSGGKKVAERYQDIKKLIK